MTKPTSLTKTFDTSLVDVQRSFCSTESNTSGSSAKEDGAPPDSLDNTDRNIHVSTSELYKQWAPTYDSDGNVLQSVDDIGSEQLLPMFLYALSNRPGIDPSGQKRPKIMDLGCGTGRNTLKVLESMWPGPVDVVGWDVSPAMLEAARRKCEKYLAASAHASFDLRAVDFADAHYLPENSIGTFDGIISTLVLEHIPLDAFFTVLERLLRPGGMALVTNMHPDMGASTRAGLKNAAGERLQGVSFVHGVDESVAAAKAAGLALVCPVKEIAVSEQMIVDGRVGSRGRKWVGVKVWYAMVLCLTSDPAVIETFGEGWE